MENKIVLTRLALGRITTMDIFYTFRNKLGLFDNNRSAKGHYDAGTTNDCFPSDGLLGELSLALYECLSARKSKGRNSGSSGTNVSLRAPMSVNITASMSSVLRYYIPFAQQDPSFGLYRIIIISYILLRKLMFG